MTPSSRRSGPRPWGSGLVGIEELVGEADFVSIHTPKTPETIGLFGRDLLAKAKPGIRIINTARGGIVDEEALADAIRDGIVAGAGLDVFAKEPCTESPLFSLPQVVVSPHLGASTEEAQDKAGVTIAEQVLLALAGDFVPYAVNVAATDVSDVVRPFMPLAEQLGRFFGCLHDGLPDVLEIECQGELAAVNTGILTLSALKGVFSGSTDEPVSYVNAPQLAEQRGLEVREISTATSRDYKSLITLRSKSHAVAGTLSSAGHRSEPRIVMVDDHVVEVAPAPHMLVVRNDDRPGMIGIVGTALGQADISISSMAVGPSPTRRDGDDGDLHRGVHAWCRGRSVTGRRGNPRHPPRQSVGASVCWTAWHLGPRVDAAHERLRPLERALRGAVRQHHRAPRRPRRPEGPGG